MVWCCMTLLQQASYLKVNWSSVILELHIIVRLFGHTVYVLVVLTRYLLRHTPVDDDVYRGNVLLGS